MALRDASLADRTDLTAGEVLLNGTQALVRLMLMQSARDRAAGHRTAGYVTGYRGSPLGAVDTQMLRAKPALDEAGIRFQAALNEDLAATAIWGTQQAQLRGEGTHDGVFSLWYGKGPGVDRSGDAMRHANFAGTAPLGGVIMAMGDDHTCESSTTLHQSDVAMLDAMMPVLSPAGVQEILDFGVMGFALSRFCGMWTGLKLMKDTVEATAVVDGDPQRMSPVLPDIALPPGGLNIRLGESPRSMEERLIVWRKPAAQAFGRANRLDRRGLGRHGARIGFAAAGKSWLDLCHALELLGIDATEAERRGITTYKIAMTWPLDTDSLRAWSEGLDLIVFVEEKRKLIEPQAKDALFNGRRDLRIHGGVDGQGRPLLPAHYALDPVMVAQALGRVLNDEGQGSEAMAAALARLDTARAAANAPELADRPPYFCAGCPHNTSTVVPDGSRAYAGIGCHTLAIFMDRDTLGFTQMGGEGANWIGESLFSTRDHVFQNMGDGTYNHSGLQAIRAAVSAGTTITYKILYNDAVAMTGGQGMDGDLTPDRICRELLAMGVGRVAVVADPKEAPDRALYPAEVTHHDRDALDAVQRDMRGHPGVTAIVYVQTCAAEKRRRRRKGGFPAADTHVFVHPEVCEGCGDCGAQSNCVALAPVDTPFGPKRAIDRSACNFDYSCQKGFCPSFVTVTGAAPRRPDPASAVVPALPDTLPPDLTGPCNVVLSGVGGTGVVTLGAVLSMAAHLEGRGTAMMEMAGMAQKGGSVSIHCRIAPAASDITAVRIAAGEADVLIGGDPVVAGHPATLEMLSTARSRAVVTRGAQPTGHFTRNPEALVPEAQLFDALAGRSAAPPLAIAARALATEVLGDSLYANMILLGAAWQAGLLPVGLAALMRAIALNGVAVEANSTAFALGRWAVADPDGLAAAHPMAGPAPSRDFEARLEIWSARLTAYQSGRLAARFRARIDAIGDSDLREVTAFSYQKCLAYKDEYEVARLLRDTRARVAAEFDGAARITHHLAPPLLGGTGPDGRPRKRRFGGWIAPILTVLSHLKVLRGSPLDPFGYTAERRAERALIVQFEDDMDTWLPRVTAGNRDLVRDLMAVPAGIRGFGPVKMQAIARAAERRRGILRELDRGALRNPRRDGGLPGPARG